MDPDSLRANAHARAAGDVAQFASFMTPQAILRLRDERLPDASNAFTIRAFSESGDFGASTVRFSGRDYELDGRWQRIDGLWKVVDANVKGRRQWLAGLGGESSSARAASR